MATFCVAKDFHQCLPFGFGLGDFLCIMFGQGLLCFLCFVAGAKQVTVKILDLLLHPDAMVDDRNGLFEANTWNGNTARIARPKASPTRQSRFLKRGRVRQLVRSLLVRFEWHTSCKN